MWLGNPSKMVSQSDPSIEQFFIILLAIINITAILSGSGGPHSQFHMHTRAPGNCCGQQNLRKLNEFWRRPNVRSIISYRFYCHLTIIAGARHRHERNSILAFLAKALTLNILYNTNNKICGT